MLVSAVKPMLLRAAGFLNDVILPAKHHDTGAPSGRPAAHPAAGGGGVPCMRLCDLSDAIAGFVRACVEACATNANVSAATATDGAQSNCSLVPAQCASCLAPALAAGGRVDGVVYR